MSLILLAIKFNHDPNSATHDALNIRKNATQIITVPEWQRGISVNASDSRAAYAIAETLGRAIRIQAKFARIDPQLTSVEVRAVPVSPFAPLISQLEVLLLSTVGTPQFSFYLTLYYTLLEMARAGRENLLGFVRARRVDFVNIESAFETFELTEHRLWAQGVGVQNVTWRWQYRRIAAEPWIDFAESKHRIYTVLDVPNQPWQQQPFLLANTSLPWTDVLDYACRWAERTTNFADAAIQVTRAVFELGPAVMEYDCPGLGSSHYTIVFPFEAFDCTAFLNLLQGGFGNGRLVNCTDCACVVSTFSNILGCSLFQSRMFSDSGVLFPVNPILAIGSSVWQRPCNFPGFSFHEVAWEGASDENTNVFDACLLVNGAFDPTRPPEIPLLPANLRFGNIFEREYRFRLVPAAGLLLCEPQPFTSRQRRPVI